jgi:hypothetical protein
VTSLRTTTATLDDPAYSVEYLHDTKACSKGKRDQITDGLIEVTWRAVRGPDPAYFETSFEGWTSFYAETGNRVEDYDRLLLIYIDGRLIHFTGIMSLQLSKELSIVWAHISATDPDHQGRGVLSRSLAALVDIDWLRSFPGRTYVVCRTPNPLIYEAMRKVIGMVPAWEPMFHPKINADGSVERPAEEARRVAEQIAFRLSPECDFDSETFVMRGFLKKYGEIYREIPPPSRKEGTTRFFDQHIDIGNQDALLVIFEVT